MWPARALSLLLVLATTGLAETASVPTERVLGRHTSVVNSVAFSPDGRWVASGSLDGVRLWEVATKTQARALAAGEVWSVAFSPDGRWLASGDLEGAIKLWDVATGGEVRTFSGNYRSVSASPNKIVRSVAFSPDGRWLAAGDYDRNLRLWEVTTGKPVSIVFGGSGTVVAFSPNGKLLAAGDSLGTIRLWEAATGKQVFSIAAKTDSINSIAFSPDGRWLACGIREGTRLWEVKTGQEVRTFAESRGSVIFSPDGRWLASGYLFTIRVWDVAKGDELFSFDGYSSVRSIAFSRDGHWLALGDFETVRLWNLGTLTGAAQLPFPRGSVFKAAPSLSQAEKEAVEKRAEAARRYFSLLTDLGILGTLLSAVGFVSWTVVIYYAFKWGGFLQGLLCLCIPVYALYYVWFELEHERKEQIRAGLTIGFIGLLLLFFASTEMVEKFM